MEQKWIWVNERKVSEITGFALPTLRNDRHMGKGIPYSKRGRSVRYRLQDVYDYMEARRINTEG
jgi:hypothetical protein